MFMCLSLETDSLQTILFAHSGCSSSAQNAANKTVILGASPNLLQRTLNMSGPSLRILGRATSSSESGILISELLLATEISWSFSLVASSLAQFSFHPLSSHHLLTVSTIYIN
jgi:hypothetical protein